MEVSAGPAAPRLHLGAVSPKNVFAPVLGGGHFTQPGADGGELLNAVA